MNKVFNIGGYRIALSDVLYLKEYHFENPREYIGDKGKVWFPLCLFKEEWEGHKVHYDMLGGRYIMRGKKSHGLLIILNRHEIDIPYDEKFVKDWIEYKESL